jgi:hypothetical protein
MPEEKFSRQDKLSKEVLDTVRSINQRKKQPLDEDTQPQKKRNPPPRTPNLKQEKVPQKARDAFQFMHYKDGLTARKMGETSLVIYKIEHGGSVSADKVLEVIKRVWGFDSFGELIKAADAAKQMNKSGKWTDMVNNKSGNRSGQRGLG